MLNFVLAGESEDRGEGGAAGEDGDEEAGERAQGPRAATGEAQDRPSRENVKKSISTYVVCKYFCNWKWTFKGLKNTQHCRRRTRGRRS